MSDCDKTGCRKIAYVCEDCGRKTNAVDLLPFIAERDALKAELDRLKTGKTQFCVQCERYARELEKANWQVAQLQALDMSHVKLIGKLEDELETSHKDADQLAEAIEAKEQLLICHRVGKRPSEKLWAQLEKATKALSAHEALRGKQ